MKLVIFGNNYQDANLQAILSLVERLRERGVEVTLERDFNDYLTAQTGAELRLPTVCCGDRVDADVALSLGGDGTFLTTVMWSKTSPSWVSIWVIWATWLPTV